jgi:hypothetical protein
MGILVNIAVEAGKAALAEAIKEVMGSLTGGRSCVLHINNNTDLTLNKTGEDLSHGGWGMPPESQIPPKHALVFGAESSGFMTGAEGKVTFSGGGVDLVVYWDNPWAGSNGCDLTVSGPKAGDVRPNHACGVGNEGAHMLYELYPVLGWQRFELAPAGSAPGTARITAVSRVPGSMEVFWVAPDGSVQDAYWYDKSEWKRFALAPPGSASPAGELKVISRIPESLEIWWPAGNGSLQDSFWYAGQ